MYTFFQPYLFINRSAFYILSIHKGSITHCIYYMQKSYDMHIQCKRIYKTLRKRVMHKPLVNWKSICGMLDLVVVVDLFSFCSPEDAHYRVSLYELYGADAWLGMHCPCTVVCECSTGCPLPDVTCNYCPLALAFQTLYFSSISHCPVRSSSDPPTCFERQPGTFSLATMISHETSHSRQGQPISGSTLLWATPCHCQPAVF